MNNENLYTDGMQALGQENYWEALKFFRAAYNNGNIKAAYEIGRLYMENCQIGVNYSEAFRWLSKGAEHGNKESQYYLSKFYEYDLLECFDMDQAYYWLNQAAEQKENRALYHLSVWYQLGVCVPKDIHKSEELLILSAQQGNADALYQLGVLYEYGDSSFGYSVNLEKALGYFSEAAKLEHPEALLHMAKLYYEDNRSQCNLDKVMKALELSASLGCNEAQYLLYCIYRKWFSNSQNMQVKWLFSAAASGHEKAMYEYGCMLLVGNSYISKNPEEARIWLKKSASMGNQMAQKVLERMIHHSSVSCY